MKQREKDIRAHAHDVLWDLDRKTLWFGGNSEEAEEGKAVESSLKALKHILLDEHAGPEKIKDATEELSSNYRKFEIKKESKNKKTTEEKEVKDGESVLRAAEEVAAEQREKEEKELQEKKDKAEAEGTEEAEREELQTASEGENTTSTAEDAQATSIMTQSSSEAEQETKTPVNAEETTVAKMR